MVGRNPVEVAKTVLEVADVAWTAMECCHHHAHGHHHKDCTPIPSSPSDKDGEAELFSLQSENRHLRNLLEQNLGLLQKIAQSPSILQDCPPDLHARLLAAVQSESFINQLDSLHHKLGDRDFPFKQASGVDLETAEMLINVDHEEPSWWVWVTDEMVPRTIEERSEIDDENYVIISEEHVVDGVANFMARCILSNSNAQKMSPQDLQKTLTKALGGMNKLEKMLNVWHAGSMFYTLSTWGLAVAGLYRSRAVLRVAAMGVHATSKVVLRAL